MAPKRFPHVVLRSGWYQYHRRVPTAVQRNSEAFERLFASRPIYRRSLNTKIYHKALEQAAIVESEFERLLNQATGPTINTVIRIPRELTDVALAEVADYVRTHIIREWRSMVKWAQTDEDSARHLSIRLDGVIDCRDRDEKLEVLVGSSFAEAASKINDEWAFGVPKDSSPFSELVLAVRDGANAAYHGVSEILEGNSLPNEPSSSLIQLGRRPANAPTSKRFSEVAAEQIKTGSYSSKTVVKMNRAQALFIRLLGDKCVQDITRDDVTAFLDGLSMQTVGASSGLARRITRQTMQSYLTQISSPLSFAIDRGWMKEPNPAKGFNLARWAKSADPKDRRRRFEIGELNLLLQHPWFTGCLSSKNVYGPGTHLLNDVRFWGPMVGLYTGARVAELGGLKLSEVKLDDLHPHIVIQCNEYRDTKSKMSRHVPILDALITLGFADYVASMRRRGVDRLFPDWEPPVSKPTSDKFPNWANSKWIRAFNRTVIDDVFPAARSAGSKSPLVFHSLRGTFKTLLLNNAPRHVANAVLGHNQDDLDKAYIGALTPEETFETLRHVNFKGLRQLTRRQATN